MINVKILHGIVEHRNIGTNTKYLMHIYSIIPYGEFVIKYQQTSKEN